MELQNLIPTVRVATLPELEERISRGLETFIDVGLCLMEIRDRRLYKEAGYAAFENYCREKWGWNRAHAYRQIEAAKTAKILSPMGDTSERQMREIAPLVREDEQEAVEVWRELKEEYGNDVTAKRVKQVVKNRLERIRRERKAVERREADPAPEPQGDIKIFLKDFRELQIEPQSVDLIFTDPPYGKEYLSLYGDLAAFAARALKPGALLVTYSGQFYLPEVIRQLEEHLNYVWTGAIWINGQHGVVRPLQIWYRYKPLFFFSAGTYEPKGWFEDVVMASQEKSLHDWQQSLGEALYFLEKLSGPGNLIVDPFLGSGTTGLAAKQLGRSFIGCDVDPAAIDTAKRRLA